MIPVPIDESMLAAALTRLKWAACGPRRADVARRAVAEIEAAVASCRPEVNASVPVVLTDDGATFMGHFLAEARLAVREDKVVLVRKRFGTNDEFVLGWWNLRAKIRDNVAHALPALVDAVAAALLEGQA